MAVYDSEYYAGKPAITVNEYGKGKCYYVGCDLDDDATIALMKFIAGQCRVAPALENVPAGVEVVKKAAKDGKEFWFATNFSRQEVSFELPFAAKEIASGEELGKTVTLPLHGSAVFTKL